MLTSLLHGQAPLLLLLFFVLPQLILARVPITSLPIASFFNIFNTYPSTGNGGCDRDSPDGIPMMLHTLNSLGGAWAVAQTTSQNLPSYPTETYIRGLLFLFFGITFQADQQLNADPNNVNAYNAILNTFDMVNNVFTNPGYNLYNLKPRYRCLEDYASYFEHLPGSDGKENRSAPLVGAWYDQGLPGGLKRPAPYNDIWPGLMRVDNQLDGSKTWYTPNPSDPPNGICGPPPSQNGPVTEAFTNSDYSRNPTNNAKANAIYGITACSSHFTEPLLANLGTPTGIGGWDEVLRFLRNSDLMDLHELIHLVTSGLVIDQPSVQPPAPDQWYTNTIYATWTSNPAMVAYGYLNAVFLGLARPLAARLNADNYAKFGGCMYFPQLNCLGNFQYHIRTRRSVPAGLSPRAVERIRSGEFDLTKDLPMDLDLEQKPASKRTAGDSDFEFGEMDESRFRDVDAPSPMLA